MTMTLSKTLLERLYSSQRWTMRLGRWLLIGAFIFAGVYRLFWLSTYIDTGKLYSGTFYKDILNDYLAARAVINGESPYLSLKDLANEAIGENTFFNHPTPHPPFIILLSLPIGYLSIETVYVLWFIAQIITLFGIICLVLLLFDTKPKLLKIIFGVLVLLSWHAVAEDIQYGNFSIFLLALVMVAWWAISHKRNFAAGAILGFAMAIKMVFWPIILFFLLKKNYRLSFTAGLFFAGFNLLGGLFIGFDQTIYYYTSVTRSVAKIYQAAEFNTSLWSLGYRIFSGTRSGEIPFLDAPPLMPMSWLSGWFSLMLVAIVFILSMVLFLRAKDVEIGFAGMICLSLLVSPMTWPHYYVLALVPILVLAKRLAARSYPDFSVLQYLAAAMFLYIPHLLLAFTAIFFSENPQYEVVYSIDFWPSLITMLHSIAIFWLSFQLSASQPIMQNQ